MTEQEKDVKDLYDKLVLAEQKFDEVRHIFLNYGNLLSDFSVALGEYMTVILTKVNPDPTIEISRFDLLMIRNTLKFAREEIQNNMFNVVEIGKCLDYIANQESKLTLMLLPEEE